MDNAKEKNMILVLGATGFLGKRVCKKLDSLKLPYNTASLSLGTDLRNYDETQLLFKKCKPNYILNCAAYVGGIQFGYKHFAEIYRNNLLMTINLFEAAKEIAELKRIVNPISNCAYPANATLFKESEFWDGPLHESVMVYGFVRKASWMGSWAYQKQYGLDVINFILSNMYGPEDHFDAERSHALGALISKIINAKMEKKPFVDVWGSGKPVREWLHVDDGAEAMIRGMNMTSCESPINIGVGKGLSIIELAEKIAEYAEYKGEIKLDSTKPDGAPYKTVDGSFGEKIMNWKPGIDFDTGLQDTVRWYIENKIKGSIHA